MDNTTKLFNELGIFRPTLFPTKEQDFEEHPLKEKIIEMCKQLDGFTNSQIKEIFSFMKYYLDNKGKITLKT